MSPEVNEEVLFSAMWAKECLLWVTPGRAISMWRLTSKPDISGLDFVG